MGKKIFYFVDYENVHEAGLQGMNTLPKDSEVHLFYSQNANKLNLDLLRFVKAKVRVHKVKPGKQSLDMQMVSYLGYCIGDEEEEGTYILVSKDTDYANTVLFWREEGIEVRVQPAILEEKNADGMERALRSVKITRRGRRGGRRSSGTQQSAAVEETRPQEAPKEAAAEEKPVLKEEAVKEEKTVMPAEDKKPLPDENEPAVPGPVPSENTKEERGRSSRGGRRRGRPRKEGKEQVKEQTPESTAEPVKAETPAPKEEMPAAPTVHNNKVPDEPARVTVTVHDVPMVTHAVPQIKDPVPSADAEAPKEAKVSKPSKEAGESRPSKAAKAAKGSKEAGTGKAARETGTEKTQAAARVQALLAEKKTDPSVTRKVVSIVQKHEGQKNSRQAIYLEIRKTFGQKMGVDLYNSFKGLLK